MKRAVLVVLMAGGLVGCDRVNLDLLQPKETARPESASLPDGTVRPVPRPDNLAEVVVEDRPDARSGPLGVTIVSLGTATEPGMWLKTPLVARTRPGKVSWSGKSVAVSLIPIEGESSAGSRISLQAMQALGMPLTELTEVQVSAD